MAKKKDSQYTAEPEPSVYDVLVEIRNILEDMREEVLMTLETSYPQADVARDVKKLEQARKF